MKKNVKIGIGVGVVSLAAIAIAIPVFKDVNVNKLAVDNDKVYALNAVDENATTDITEDDNEVKEVVLEGIDGANDKTVEVKLVDKDSKDKEGIEVEIPEEDQSPVKEGDEAPVEKAPEKEGDEGREVDYSSIDVYGESDRKYMSYCPDEYGVTAEMSAEEEIAKMYQSKPEDFADEALKAEAQKYAAKGYYLTDKKIEMEAFYKGGFVGNLFGLKGYLFNTGFDVVDKKDGNNTFIIDVLKATQDEADEFIKEYFEDCEPDSKTEDGSTVTYTYGCYKISYNSETEILTYEADLTGPGVG